MKCGLYADLSVAAVSLLTLAIVAAKSVDAPGTTVTRPPSPTLVDVCISLIANSSAGLTHKHSKHVLRAPTGKGAAPHTTLCES